jgi:hypothetical protein
MQIDTVTLVFFPASPWPFNVEQLWEKLGFEPPHNVHSRPVERIGNAFGLHEDFGVFVDLSPIRLEITMRSKDALQNGAGPVMFPPSIADRDAAFRLAKSIQEKVLSLGLPLTRLASQANCLWQRASMLDANRIVIRNSPDLSATAERLSDIAFQSNERKPSNIIDGLAINHFSQWSVYQQQSFTFFVGNPAMTPNANTDGWVARGFLDINTAPEFSGLAGNEKSLEVSHDLTDIVRKTCSIWEARANE